MKRDKTKLRVNKSSQIVLRVPRYNKIKFANACWPLSSLVLLKLSKLIIQTCINIVYTGLCFCKAGHGMPP